jgi:membrane protease YdiL (CAAX protease family)
MVKFKTVLEGAGLLLISLALAAGLGFAVHSYVVGALVGTAFALWSFWRFAGVEGRRAFASARPAVNGLATSSTVFVLFAVTITATVAIAHSQAMQLGWYWTQSEFRETLPFVFLAATLAVVVEELFFRYYLQTWFKSFVSANYVWTAIAAQALAFTGFHSIGTTGIGDYRWVHLILMGITLGILVEYCGGLVIAILLHGAWNACTLILAGLTPINLVGTPAPVFYAATLSSELWVTRVASILGWALALSVLRGLLLRSRKSRE